MGAGDYFAPQHNWQEQPVELPLRYVPALEPVVYPECADCAWCDEGRMEARGRGDLSAVADFNVELANHPHIVPKLSQLPSAQGVRS